MKTKAKKYLISFMLVLTVSATSIPVVPPTQVQAKTKYVYITKYGKKYHLSKHCRTLSRSKVIKKIKLKNAKSRGYGRCKVCG